MLGLDALVALDLSQRLMKDQFREGDARLRRPPDEVDALPRQGRASTSLVRSLTRLTPRPSRVIADSGRR
jgi:hypothetical protein